MFKQQVDIVAMNEEWRGETFTDKTPDSFAQFPESSSSKSGRYGRVSSSIRKSIDRHSGPLLGQSLNLTAKEKLPEED
jgi:hypothetical protein